MVKNPLGDFENCAAEISNLRCGIFEFPQRDFQKDAAEFLTYLKNLYKGAVVLVSEN